MERAQISTQWVGTGTGEDSNRPRVSDDYPHIFPTMQQDTGNVDEGGNAIFETVDNPDAVEGILWWTDVTAQPSENLRPDPNQYIIEVRAESSVIDLIEADSNYLVNWREEYLG